jgi:hypothetical protein
MAFSTTHKTSEYLIMFTCLSIKILSIYVQKFAIILVRQCIFRTYISATVDTVSLNNSQTNQLALLFKIGLPVPLCLCLRRQNKLNRLYCNVRSDIFMTVQIRGLLFFSKFRHCVI